MTPPPAKLLFLPGASGNTQFWHPVAERLANPAQKLHIGWPGFGDTPPVPGITGMENLAARVLAEIDRPTALVAQSMGGIVAVLAALERPELITHLVLTVTSGGVDMSDLDAQDWRPDFAAANPTLPRWFLDDRTDLTLRLAELRMPVLLLWGDADLISPVRVGQRLAQLLPQAELHVFPGADHSLGSTHADEVARLIDRHLAYR
ncbi:alpha/beta hydrolase [Pseudomonas sp. B21-056]|uniref:alpha/beta fold hydrolase n=1 Tax=Pseudomonas sp. B21-056 TaxID=2895495 RepID=UPI00222EA336|nr:alpha/beta hydrolase [Pseudomonas sp. B21-056]UZE23908.1 alpha/beta hydrolase [Pseudomonas sp. B21-056]